MSKVDQEKGMRTSTSPPQYVAVPGERVGPDVSLQTVKTVESYLRESGQFGNYERLPLDYDQLDPQTLDGQVAMSVILIQPHGVTSFGDLDPETEIVMTTQQEGRYDAGKRAVPMGKIDLTKDIFSAKDTARQVIINAADRERWEETENTPSQRVTILAGSFVDKKTSFIIHVVIESVVATTEDNTMPFSVSLSEEQEREVAGIQIVKMTELAQAEPISNGVKYGLLIALEAIKARNKLVADNL